MRIKKKCKQKCGYVDKGEWRLFYYPRKEDRSGNFFIKKKIKKKKDRDDVSVISHVA